MVFYDFRFGRRLNGSRTATPVGSKSDTLRVTTVSPCSSAVAAIMRSALSLPRRRSGSPNAARLAGRMARPARRTGSGRGPTSPQERPQGLDHGALSRNAALYFADADDAEEKFGRALLFEPLDDLGSRSRLRNSDNVTVSIRCASKLPHRAAAPFKAREFVAILRHREQQFRKGRRLNSIKPLQTLVLRHVDNHDSWLAVLCDSLRHAPRSFNNLAEPIFCVLDRPIATCAIRFVSAS